MVMSLMLGPQTEPLLRPVSSQVTLTTFNPWSWTMRFTSWSQTMDSTFWMVAS